MKKACLAFFFLTSFWTVKGQMQSDTFDQKVIDQSFLYVGSTASLISSFPNANALIGYNFYTKNAAIASEIEIGYIFSEKTELLKRFTIKYYPRIKIKPKDAFVIGIGVQSYAYTKSKNGLFSRFNNNYRQEILYSVRHSLKNIFVTGGVRNSISDRIFYEVHAIVGVGNKNIEISNIPDDAVYLGNGKLFGPRGLPESKNDHLLVNYKFLLAYRF